jgi:hypothetical protein
MRKPVAREARQPAVAKTAVCRQSARLGDGIAAIERCCAALVLIRTARVSVLLILTIVRRGSLAARTVLEWTVLEWTVLEWTVLEWTVLERMLRRDRAGVRRDIQLKGARYTTWSSAALFSRRAAAISSRRAVLLTPLAPPTKNTARTYEPCPAIACLHVGRCRLSADWKCLRS